MARVIRHPRLNLAAAYRIDPTRRFDPRVVSRKELKPKPQLIRHQRSYFANNGKLKRSEVLRREAEKEARYLAEHPSQAVFSVRAKPMIGSICRSDPLKP